jgi:hypothetical protein
MSYIYLARGIRHRPFPPASMPCFNATCRFGDETLVPPSLFARSSGSGCIVAGRLAGAESSPRANQRLPPSSAARQISSLQESRGSDQQLPVGRGRGSQRPRLPLRFLEDCAYENEGIDTGDTRPVGIRARALEEETTGTRSEATSRSDAGAAPSASDPAHRTRRPRGLGDRLSGQLIRSRNR